MDSIATIAAKTEEILQQGGWNKGFLSLTEIGGSISHCVGGALNMAMTGSDSWSFTPDSMSVYTELAGIIRAEFPGRVYQGASEISAIAAWNNHELTTREDVSRALAVLGTKELAHAG